MIDIFLMIEIQGQLVSKSFHGFLCSFISRACDVPCRPAVDNL